MSFRANVQIAIALNVLTISSFRKQGTMRFRMTLQQTRNSLSDPSQKNKSVQTIPCPPYNIYKQNNKFAGMSKESSFIDNDLECYFSPLFLSKFQIQQHPLQQICFFRLYADVEQLSKMRLLLKVELIFTPDGQSTCTQLGKYEGQIHIIGSTAVYLPIFFDDFGGFAISSTYQSTIMDYKFQASENNNQLATFSNYLHVVSKGSRSQDLIQFYQYYRNSLETQLFTVQQRHSDLLRVLNIPNKYGFIKVGPNEALLQLLGSIDSIRMSKQQTRDHLWGMQSLRDRLAAQISNDYNSLKGLIYQKWNEYLLFLGANISHITQYFKAKHDKHVVERLKANIFSHQVQPGHDWTCSRYQDSGKEMLLQAQMDKKKQNQQELWRDLFPIENKAYFQQQRKTIKVFEEVYPVSISRRSFTRPPTTASSRKSSFDSSKSMLEINSFHQNHFFSSRSIAQIPQQKISQPVSCKSMVNQKMYQQLSGGSKESSIKGQHVIVFVHGFQASRQDFALFKACLQIKYQCRVFISSCNEGRTEQSIQSLGKRLAIELNSFFQSVDFSPSTRISFVGHSMGGIIIRSALSYIRNLTPYLYAYLSFSSPHLGYLYQPSRLIQAGLWLLNAWQHSQSLQQICMDDNKDLRNCYLYKLSQNKSLNGFRHLALVSSTQDEYVPYESARIQKNPHLLQQLNESNVCVVRQMVDNLLGDVNCQSISRMNVVFNIEDRNFDSIVGRTAHVKYLSDCKFINMFTTVFERFFR